MNELNRSGGAFARLAVLCCMSLILYGAAYSQQSRISGQVFGADRRPLADIYVELLNELGSIVSRYKTDGIGGYFFSSLTAGRFTVRVRPFGTNYEEQSQDVEINTFVGGRQVADHQQKDFFLKERKVPGAPSGAPGVVFAQTIPEQALTAYQRAIGHFESNRPDAGLSELRAAISIFPDYFVALERLGVELINRQQFEEAQARFTKAVAVNNRCSNCWYGLAFAFYATDADKAVDAAKKAATLAPDSADIALLLGISLRKDKRYSEAEKALLKAKKLSNGKSADVYWNLALLYAHNLKKYRRAADELESYLKIKPDHPNAELLRKLVKQYRSAA